ncbi:E3 ubiquitin-protein ligase RING1-like [Lycium barbarum]|uniref:E3 ubiquitin-protein ligase RING1-like n=1 Tax=Lycium barbarum TaxID=112863 RepID=UPI00293EB25C|nr:E3 ubiquitin-protein ligase RING1-like [Lycium barbarum]XP_060171130.1 E3 ubiquitin-protein ligase RING1-like [Lycium barbarum]XP_060171133.1 E3 ubiquitin-protein ligase RING1-like [Lycium barbarum]
MSSTGNLDVTGNSPQNYYCYECQHTVTLPTNSELCCPNCNSTFLEQSDTAPAPPPHHPITHNSNNPFENDLSALFGGVAFSGRSPNEFDPFAFLNDYLRAAAGDANIQLVFENNNEFGSGLPGNFGDYFLGPGLEQLIQQLAENDPNRSGPPPAAKSVVLGLPDVKVSDELLNSDSSQCAVCKDCFEVNELVKQMPCKHIYHKDCILPWLELHNSCPVCRYELPTDDTDYENMKTTSQQPTNTSSNNNNDNIPSVIPRVGSGNTSRNNNNIRSVIPQVGSGNTSRNANTNNNAGAGWFSLGLEGIGNQENPLIPRTVERRVRISLPGLLRGLGSHAETSDSQGGGSNSNNDSGSSNTPGESNPCSGGQTRMEDLD